MNTQENKRGTENIILALLAFLVIIACGFVVYHESRKEMLQEVHEKLHKNVAEHSDCFACNFEEWEVE